MIRLLLILNVLAGAAVGQEVSTDAFGAFPTAEMGERENWAGLRSTSTGNSIMQTAGPSDAAILFVGPKSIVAGIEPGHAVAIGLDIFGNMVDGVPTQFVLGFGEDASVSTQDGIADVLFTPPPKSGVFLAGADVGGVQSSRADYRVTAHLATVQPQFAPGDATVLPESFAQMSTDLLVDGYGNIVDDGIGLNILLRNEKGQTTFMPSVVRDGAARSNLLTRDVSGGISAELAMAGTHAGGLRFVIEDMKLKDTGAFAMWAEPSINAVHLRIGPMETSAGYLVPDGTSAFVTVKTAAGSLQDAQGWVLDGYVSFVLRLGPESAPYDVSFRVGENVVDRTVALSERPENLILRGAE